MDLEILQLNVFPAMLEHFAATLGLKTVKPLRDLGIGFWPGDGSWVYPERDTQGHLVGYMRRYLDGKKRFIKGGKRGFIYAKDLGGSTIKSNEYIPGSHNWTRVSEHNPCPVCGRTDWCLISSQSVENPAAVICPRTKDESKCKIGNAGYLHVLRPDEFNGNHGQGKLPDTKYPILIVEGMTDWAAATELGFIAIGKPMADINSLPLKDLVAGQDVVILGDNDVTGIGEKGVESTFIAIRKFCKSATKLLPPEGIKDLREWYTVHGLTADDLLNEIRSRGSSANSGFVLQSDAPLDVIRSFLEQKYMHGDLVTIRNYKNDWLRYEDGVYRPFQEEKFRQELYEYLEDKSFVKDNGKGDVIVAAKPNRNAIGNYIDATYRWSYTEDSPPIWYGKDDFNPLDYINFKNCILNVRKYIWEDKIEVLPHTPEFFTIAQIPHNFNPNAKSQLVEDVHWDVLSNDQEKYDLWWEWVGHGLIPDMSLEQFLLMVGQPRSGKGTLCKYLTELYGNELCTSTSFHSLSRNFGLETFMGKYMALMYEQGNSRSSDPAMVLERIKQITGGDGIDIDRKFKRALSLEKLTCRFTMAVNTLPSFPDHAAALHSRLNIMAFRECYEGREDRSIKRKMCQDCEAGIILALAGLKRLMKNGGVFTRPKDSEQMYKELSFILTPMISFVEDCCVIDDEAWISQHELYEGWTEWATLNGMKPGTLPALSQRLLSLKRTSGIETSFQNVEGRKVRVFRGITLNEYGRKLIGGC